MWRNVKKFVRSANMHYFGQTEESVRTEPNRMGDKVSSKKNEQFRVSENFEFLDFIEAAPLDGSRSFCAVIKQMFGELIPITEKIDTFFGSFDSKPQCLNVEIQPGIFEDIFWGQFKIPGIENPVKTGIHQKNGSYYFLIRSTINESERSILKEISDKTKEHLKLNSMFRGRAIKLRVSDSGKIEQQLAPEFINTKNTAQLFYSEHLKEQVDTNLFSPIEYTEECRQLKIPLKRCILLHGKYGTGKTLAALEAAKKAVENGWTFIMVDRVSAIADAFRFALMYQPAIVFAEDVDRVVSGSERTVQIDDVLNTLDGIEAKNCEVMTVFTSNDANSITPAMMRPGRIDAIIHVSAPDSETAEKLIRFFAGSYLQESLKIKKAVIAMTNQIPAIIRETIERAKLKSIREASDGNIQITQNALDSAVAEMKAHIEIMNMDREHECEYSVVGKSIQTAFMKISDASDEAYDNRHKDND